MGQPRHLFAVAIPALWSTTMAVAFRYPGDEYALWAVGALPGLWLPILVGEGNLTRCLAFTLSAGVVVTAGFGAVRDRVRVRWLHWYALWVIAAGAICAWQIASFPSWARAMSKNGSFQAYALFSLNAGLMLSTTTMIAAVAAWHTGRRLIALPRRRSPVSPPIP